MKEILFLSVAISIIFFIVRAVELKFVKKQELDPKNLAMDSLYVFISSSFAQLIMGQIGDIGDIGSMLGGGIEGVSDGGANGNVPGVFTNNPEF